jgi:hypothetical protein
VKILIITVLNFKEINLHTNVLSGADPGFQVRGGALKKIAPSGGRRENVRGITCDPPLIIIEPMTEHTCISETQVKVSVNESGLLLLFLTWQSQ